MLILGNSIFEGVGTALLIPPVYILTTLLFTEVTSRARAFGAISAMGGIGAAAGPVDRRSDHLGDQLAGGVRLPGVGHRRDSLASRDRSRIRFRPIRPVGSTPAARSCRRSVSSWSSLGILAADNNVWLMLVLIVAGVLVLTWFFVFVRAEERAGKEPLLSTSLFRNRTSNLGLVTQNTQWLLLIGVSFVVSAYLQVVRGYDAIQTGVIFTAATVGLLATSLGRRAPGEAPAPADPDHGRLRRHDRRRRRPPVPGRRLAKRLGLRSRTAA